MKILFSVSVILTSLCLIFFYHPQTIKSADWECGDAVNFIYNGAPVTYYTTSSLGLCWMDRNLGASRVATNATDTQAYGDLFQWGRFSDGHQLRTSNATETLSSSDSPGHPNFIEMWTEPNDWRSPQNNSLWQGTLGTNNPCPTGWRIPTKEEWQAEADVWAPAGYNGAWNSPLRLTAAGSRTHWDAALIEDVGTVGYYWASTINGTTSYQVGFDSGGEWVTSVYRGFGNSVRCVSLGYNPDGIIVYGTVQEYLSFAASTNTVALAPDLVDSSGNPHIASSSNIILTLDTSSADGYSITVSGTGNGLASGSNYIYTAPATTTVVAGTNAFGLQATTTTPGLTLSSRFSWPFTGTVIGSASSSSAVTLASKGSAGANQTLTIRFLAAATSSQAAGNYQEIITLTALAVP